MPRSIANASGSHTYGMNQAYYAARYADWLGYPAALTLAPTAVPSWRRPPRRSGHNPATGNMAPPCSIEPRWLRSPRRRGANADCVRYSGDRRGRQRQPRGHPLRAEKRARQAHLPLDKAMAAAARKLKARQAAERLKAGTAYQAVCETCGEAHVFVDEL